MKRLSVYFLLLSVLLLFAACNSTKQTAGSPNPQGEETVDVAYGKQKKKDVTGAVSTVRTHDPTISLANYLRRVPGVRVIGNGADARITVRGGTTATLSEDPLFVVDGVPVGNNFAQVNNMLDVNDIKSVTVLKDGSSTAMYGARGNAGVIQITTKSGRDRK